MKLDTDKEWEQLAQNNPYWAVLPNKDFEHSNFDETAKEKFFSTGEKHIETLWRFITDKWDSNFKPQSILDYGCGVGRLLIPFAKRAKEVVGVDISDSMRTLAAKNCSDFNINNGFLIKPEDFLKDDKKYDLVHTFIVVQHIHPDDGMPLVQHMINSVKEGGYGALHVTYGVNHGENESEMNFLRSFINKLKYIKYYFYCKYSGTVPCKNPFEKIYMFPYDFNKIIGMVNRVSSGVVLEFVQHGVFSGCFIFFRREKKSGYVFPDDQ